MDLVSKISTDMKQAMKDRDKQTTSVLRMVLSEIKYATGNTEGDLSDEEVGKIIRSYHKKLSKSLDDYPEGEKADEIKSEIKVVENYLPQAPSVDEVKRVIAGVLASDAQRAFGPLMQKVLAELGPGADGKTVSALLKESLE